MSRVCHDAGPSFVVPPAKAEEMYHPETFGRIGTDSVRSWTAAECVRCLRIVMLQTAFVINCAFAVEHPRNSVPSAKIADKNYLFEFEAYDLPLFADNETNGRA